MSLHFKTNTDGILLQIITWLFLTRSGVICKIQRRVMFHLYNFQMEFSILNHCAQLKHGKHSAATAAAAAAESIVFRTYSCIYPLGVKTQQQLYSEPNTSGKIRSADSRPKVRPLFLYLPGLFFQHSHSTILQSVNSQFVMTKLHLFRPKYTFF